MSRATMFAAHDQENLINAHQQAAAAKSLNQSIRGLGAKTPGNKAPKTPFKIALNDENATFQAGKSILRTNGKGNENLLQTGGKKGAFVTPAGPRNRAPLGMKTTNAKAKAFQTPGEPVSEQKQMRSQSPRLRRAKVKVHQAEVDKTSEEEAEPEIEFMPPRGEALPDSPEWFSSDMNLSMLKGSNFTRGAFSTYLDPVDNNGITKSEREEREARDKRSKETDALLQQAMEESLDITNSAPKPKSQAVKTVSARPRTALSGKPVKELNSKGASTLNAKSAANMLSHVRKETSGASSFAASTAATKARFPSKLILGKKAISTKAVPTRPTHTSSARHAAASRSTIGYSQGRTVRKPLQNMIVPPPKPQTAKGKHLDSISPISTLTVESGDSNLTITPDRFVQQVRGQIEPEQQKDEEEEGLRTIQLMGLEIDDDHLETDTVDLLQSLTVCPDSLNILDEEVLEDFVLTIPHEL